MFVGDWAGPWSAAQLSAHDVFQGLQVDLSNNHPCPCEGSIVARRRQAQMRKQLQRRHAIRAILHNCAQLRPAVGRNVCNCKQLCAIAPFRFSRRFLMPRTRGSGPRARSPSDVSCYRLPGWNFKLGLCCLLHLQRQHEVPSRCDFNAGPALALNK